MVLPAFRKLWLCGWSDRVLRRRKQKSVDGYDMMPPRGGSFRHNGTMNLAGFNLGSRNLRVLLRIGYDLIGLDLDDRCTPKGSADKGRMRSNGFARFTVFFVMRK
jgi:hypothetical protein